MAGILRAYARAIRSLSQRQVLAHFLWPVLVAASAWITAGVLWWDRLARALAGFIRHYVPLSAAKREMAEQAFATSLKVVLYLASVPLAMMTSILILELVALPIIIDRVAKTDYPGIEARHGGTQWHSLRNTLLSTVITAGIALVTLPLWLLPGVGALISLALATWLNYRSFRYDVLMKHADAQELAGLPTQHRGRLLVLSLGAGLLALVPGPNLLAVPFAGLAFAHYLLHALERSRSADARVFE